MSMVKAFIHDISETGITKKLGMQRGIKRLRCSILKGSDPIVHAEDSLVIPRGVFGSYYWYESKPELYQSEIKAMQKFFPSFKMEKLSDGRLSWVGVVKPSNIRDNAAWHLQIVYDNNHPNNSSYGGSVKIYSIEPDLVELQNKLNEPIPHLLRDAKGHVYLCTSRQEDFQAGNVTTSAASALGWAVKWISVFELWIAGEVTTAQFKGHSF